MRSKAVLVTLALSFIAPMFATTARAAEPGTWGASSENGSCKRKRAKKDDGKDSKDKKKDKDKKPYGFEL